VIACVASMMMPSCTDILDKAPTTSISQATFWKDEKDAHMGFIGAYRFPSGWTLPDFTIPQGLLMLDFSGGNGTEKENFTTQNMASSTTNASSGEVAGYWSNAYSQIGHYHTFLDNIDAVPMDEAKKELWKAEVKCLRAYYYFYLAFHFQNVPMPLASMTLTEANSMSPTPQAQIYAQVESDLKAALPLLADVHTGSDFGRVTKGYARVLLGRLYLAQSKWADAAAMYKAVIDSGKYELERSNGIDSYEKLFQMGSEYSREIVFAVNYTPSLYTHVLYQYLLPEMSGGWHQYAVYNELVKEYFCSDGLSIEESPLYDNDDPYINRDIRLYASVMLPPTGTFPGSEFKGRFYNCFPVTPDGAANRNDLYNQHARSSGYSPKKGTDPTFSGNVQQTSLYSPLMRYAETLLAYLECMIESAPGSVDQAMLDLTINDVRDRVGLPGITMGNLPGTGSDQERLRAAVRKERRVELAFEGFRYFDVLRWGTASEELNHHFTGVKLSSDPAAYNFSNAQVDEDGYYMFENRLWSDHNRYFPIPQGQININPNLIQNNGYN
jgi:hypothetical protein